MLEGKFKTQLIKDLEDRFPGCIVVHLNPPPQGIPDLAIFYNSKWATLEGKKCESASHRPNQDYYVNKMNDMSFSAFICPENEGRVLDDLARSFST